MKRVVKIGLLCILIFSGCGMQPENSKSNSLFGESIGVKKLDDSLVVLDKKFPELNSEQKSGVTELRSKGLLNALSPEGLEVANRYFEIADLEKRLLGKEVYDKLVKEDLQLAKELYKADKLNLLTDEKAREVAIVGVQLEELENDLLLVDKDYPELLDMYIDVLKRVEASSKLDVLSENARSVWERNKYLTANMPQGITIEQLKDLNSSLSSKKIYSKLTSEELSIVEKLKSTNKIELLVNVNSREVALKGLEVNIIDSVLVALDNESKEFPSLTNEQKDLLKAIEKNNKLDSLSKEAQYVWSRSKLLEGLSATEIADLKKYNSILSSLDKDYPELTTEHKELLKTLENKNKLHLLSESIQYMWSRGKLLEGLPTGITVAQMKKLNKDLSVKDIYSPLTSGDAILVEKLSTNNKLNLFVNANALEVAKAGLEIYNLEKALSLEDKDYPILTEEQKSLLKTIESKNKLDSLSKEVQDIWKRSQYLSNALPKGVTIVQVKNLNKDLSNKEVYSALTAEELSLVKTLDSNNKLELLVNPKAREVAKKGLAVNKLDETLSSLDNDSKEYPELTIEQKSLFKAIEANNKLNSLSKEVQGIWIRSKLLENLPADITIAQVKKLNKDLSNKEIYSKLTKEELNLVDRLDKSSNLVVLANTNSLEVAKKGLALNKLDETLSSLDNDSKEYPELSQGQKDLLKDIEKNNKLVSLSETANSVWSRSKLLENLPVGLTIAKLKNLNIELVKLDKDSRDYPELTDVQKKLLQDLSSNNKLNLLSETSQYVWSRSELLKKLPKEVAIGQVKVLNKDLSVREPYSLLSDAELSLVRSIMFAPNLDVEALFISYNSYDVAEKGMYLASMNKDLLKVDKDYPELMSVQRTFLKDMELKNKLGMLSEYGQAVWERSKYLIANIPKGLTIRELKKLNIALSVKGVYSNLTAEEFTRVNILISANQLGLLASVNAREVAEKGVEVYKLNQALSSLTGDMKDYPVLTNEQKALLLLIESKNQLGSLSTVAQHVWSRSKLIETLPTGMTMADLKKLNADLQKLTEENKVSGITSEQAKLINLLSSTGKLDLLASSISKDIASNYTSVMKQMNPVRQYIADNKVAIESNNSEVVKGLFDILNKSNLIIDVKKVIFSRIKIGDQTAYKDNSLDVNGYGVYVSTNVNAVTYPGVFWILDTAAGRIHSGFDTSKCLAFDRGYTAYVYDCTSKEWDTQLTMKLIKEGNKITIQNSNNQCMDIKGGNVVGGSIASCSNSNVNISGIGQIDDLIWKLASKEEKAILFKVMKNRDLTPPPGVAATDYDNLSNEINTISSKPVADRPLLSDKAYNTFKILREYSRLHLLPEDYIAKAIEYAEKLEIKNSIEELVKSNNMQQLTVADYNKPENAKLKQDMINLLHKMEPTVDLSKTPVFARIDFTDNRGGLIRKGSEIWSSTGPHNNQEDTWVWVDGVIRYAPEANLCITSPADKGPVTLEECVKSEANRNYIRNKFNNNFVVKMKTQDLCLDKFDDGKIGIWTCHGNSNQVLNNDPIIKYLPFNYLSNDAIRAVSRISLSMHK